jgi:type I restriction enzyme S subunit
MKQNNNIPQGYKDSPLGVIPEDWEVKKLGEILVNTSLGGNYENAEDHSGIPVIKMGNIERGKISLEKILYLPEDSLYYRQDVLRFGDLLLNTRNTLELVGKVAIWRNELPLALYNSNLLRMQFNQESVYSNWFMNYSFNSYSSVKQLRGYATGTTSVAAIYSRDLFKLKVALPSLPEQQKIAEILSVWDEAIEKQTQLISQLEIRKEGLMQQLLTGKMRAKGHENTKWERKSLNQCMQYTPREVPKPESNFFALGVRSHGKGIFHKNDFDPEDLAMNILYEVKENDFVVNITFAWEHAVAIANAEDDGGLVSHRFPTYTFNTTIANSIFFKYYILQKRFKHELELISPGGAGRNRVMSKKDLLNISVLIPTIDEQTAIGNILSTAYNEINLAKQKLSTLKEQKKGLMQQLLTGKKRVKIKE